MLLKTKTLLQEVNKETEEVDKGAEEAVKEAEVEESQGEKCQHSYQ